MDPVVTVAMISLVGTFGGSLIGVLTSNKLTNHRLEQLEKKVDLHNKVIERTYTLEEQMKVANHRITDLEGFEKHIERNK